jgi:hypothetical protein
VEDWIDTLQLCVPGASILLVATHSDIAEKTNVDDQCTLVKNLVHARLRQHRKGVDSASTLHAMSLPRLFNGGESVRVSSTQGLGVPELRSALISFAKTASFYKEPILPSAMKLKEKLAQVGHAMLQPNALLFACIFTNNLGLLSPGMHILSCS